MKIKIWRKLTAICMAVIVLLYISQVEVVAAVVKEGQVQIDVVAILNIDEQGKKLRYPSSVTYDREMDEIYVVAGGEGKVVVYGANFFPIVSLGKGRGANSPRGVYIDKSNTLYLCQANSEHKPARITTFNAAFFPGKEIFFSSMPGGENFIPKNMIKGLSGKMYVVGQNTRGLLVLDSDGKFSHWLKPMDKLTSGTSKDMTRADGVELSTELPTRLEPRQDNVEKKPQVVNMRDLLPPDLLPSIGKEEIPVADKEEKPVQVADVTTDSAGHLYVLSEETSKIYVYSQAEELLFSFGQKGGSTGKMSRPKSLVVDEKKNALYVVDYMRHTILIFDLGGKFMYEFGGMGTGPGWFQYPIGLALNKDGNLIVADLFNQRVQILDVKFEYTFPLFKNREIKKASPHKEKEADVPASKDEDGTIYLPEPIYF